MDPFRSTFVPSPWLSNAHVQTIFPALFRKTTLPWLTRQTIETPDEDTVVVYRLKGKELSPTVLLINGLEGSVRSHYIGGFLALLKREGWNAVAMEHRGCSGELNRAPRLYHSGETSDLDFVAKKLVKENPSGKLYLVGFSLGANLAGKWLGEFQGTPPASRAVMISTPFDLTPCGPQIDKVLNGFYAKRFLKTLIPKAKAKARQFPDHFDATGLEEVRSIVEYDDRVTAPWHGFRDVWDYYERCGCHLVLDKVTVPTLLLSAEDDPLVPASCIPHKKIAANHCLYDGIMKKGGHLGFVEGNPLSGVHYWWESAALEFLKRKEGDQDNLGLS